MFHFTFFITPPVLPMNVGYQVAVVIRTRARYQVTDTINGRMQLLILIVFFPASLCDATAPHIRRDL